MGDEHSIDNPIDSEFQNLSEKINGNVDANRKEFEVEETLKDIPGVTTPMLAAFAKHGIRSVEDLAGCATDDLDGWGEFKDGKAIRHAGILDRYRVSRKDCEAIIINARTRMVQIIECAFHDFKFVSGCLHQLQ